MSTRENTWYRHWCNPSSYIYIGTMENKLESPSNQKSWIAVAKKGFILHTVHCSRMSKTQVVDRAGNSDDVGS